MCQDYDDSCSLLILCGLFLSTTFINGQICHLLDEQAVKSNYFTNSGYQDPSLIFHGWFEKNSYPST